MKQPKRIDDVIRIHTDGSIFKHLNDIGGFGAVLTHKSTYKEMAYRVKNTTVNRMEMMGAIYSLELLNDSDKKIKVFSDSQYLILGMNDWMEGWLRKNWRGSSGKPVKNKDLWVILSELNSRLSIEWIWRRGHVGHEFNEIADSLARSAALGSYDCTGGVTEEELLKQIARFKRGNALIQKLKLSQNCK